MFFSVCVLVSVHVLFATHSAHTTIHDTHPTAPRESQPTHTHLTAFCSTEAGSRSKVAPNFRLRHERRSQYLHSRVSHVWVYHADRHDTPSLFLLCSALPWRRTTQIREAIEYVIGEHVGGARSSERETRLINKVAQALVGEEELANPTKVSS